MCSIASTMDKSKTTSSVEFDLVILESSIKTIDFVSYTSCYKLQVTWTAMLKHLGKST